MTTLNIIHKSIGSKEKAMEDAFDSNTNNI